ncbi:MAG TPA: hypothetical protein PK423_06420, partial [Clostridiales bacterium]|nr:hypothetical protein [Clostridiales bacterium]
RGSRVFDFGVLCSTRREPDEHKSFVWLVFVYGICVNWCVEEGVTNPCSLSDRIVPHRDHERLWRKRRMEMTL